MLPSVVAGITIVVFGIESTNLTPGLTIPVIGSHALYVPSITISPFTIIVHIPGVGFNILILVTWFPVFNTKK